MACRIGKEKQLAANLLNKYLCLKGKKGALKIFSVSAMDRFKGRIFIEAARMTHVQKAI